MKLVEFKREHLTGIKYKGIDLAIPTIDEIPDRHKGPAVTLIDDHEQIIGCAGVSIFWPGVGEGWTILSDLIHKYPLAFHKAAIGFLGRVEKEYGMYRIQASCLKGFFRAEKWLIVLGFEYEGEMRKYGPKGETHYRYARIR